MEETTLSLQTESWISLGMSSTFSSLKFIPSNASSWNTHKPWQHIHHSSAQTSTRRHRSTGKTLETKSSDTASSTTVPPAGSGHPRERPWHEEHRSENFTKNITWSSAHHLLQFMHLKEGQEVTGVSSRWTNHLTRAFLSTESSENAANTSWHASITSTHIIPSLKRPQRSWSSSQQHV